MSYIRQTRLDIGKRLAIYGLLAILFALLGISGTLLVNSRKEAVSENNTAGVPEQKKLSVVRAKQNIEAGERAELTKFEVVSIQRELMPPEAVTSIQQLQNKRVSNTLYEKEILLQSDIVESGDWYEDGDRLIEHTFSDGTIPSTVEVGSVVDIKLFKPKAEDRVVISKTSVIGKANNTLSFYLNETEQENLKEANIEGQMFLVQYLDKSQPGSAVNYFPEYNQGKNALVNNSNLIGGE